MNPYSNLTFFPFFGMLLKRVWQFLTLEPLQLAPDELQLLVLLSVGVASALVGTWLVLRKMAMLANALSHTILLGIVFAFILWQTLHDTTQFATLSMPLPYLFGAAIAMGLITTFLTEILTRHGRLQEEASIGVVFTTLFALGVTLVNLAARNAHIGVEAVTGNVDALTSEDLYLVLPTLFLSLILLITFHKELLISTFDAAFARALGFKSQLITYGLMTLVSLTIISAFRAVGVIMVLALLTIPANIARLYFDSVKMILFVASLIAAAVALLSVALSRHLLTDLGLPLSTGGLLVLILTLFALVAFSLKRLRARRPTGQPPLGLEEPHWKD